MAVLTKQERTAKIRDIVEKVTQMTDEQLGNVYEYTADEFAEPNHEAEALNAVIQLSRKYGVYRLFADESDYYEYMND